MSDLSSDSVNVNLSWEFDIIGSSSTDSDSTDRTEDEVEQAPRTLDYLSDVSDIPTLRRLVMPTSIAREGIGRLMQILQVGPVTRPDRSFLEELNGASTPVQPPLVDLTVGRICSCRTRTICNNRPF
ncbi:hypothetical protein TIFTF001_028495 [Ficus carica]|uniref:Uncharacterized protein n=1 Tax=Ficus carica TaxID=3494 RepID=A0AA88J1K2_FICCA|nr:hypothetical protein TIFTF001_028495 [Ficus carica]